MWARVLNSQYSEAHTQISYRSRANLEILPPRLKAPGHELNTLSVGGGGNLAVAGNQAGELLFWDRRTGQQLALFADTHAGAVTKVCGTLGTGICTWGRAYH